MEEYVIYPDGEIYQEAPSWKSDDYFTIEVPDDIEDVEEWLEEQSMAVRLGNYCEQRKLI